MEDIDLIFKESLKGSHETLSTENNEYWNIKSKKRKRSVLFFIFFLLKLIRLSTCFLFWFLSNNFFSLLKKQNSKFILLTRSKGIRDINSLEDYRFRGLEKELSKYGKVCFYIHGNLQKINFSFAPRFYDEDFNYFAEFIAFGFGFQNQRFEYVWEQDLKVNNKQENYKYIYNSKHNFFKMETSFLSSNVIM